MLKSLLLQYSSCHDLQLFHLVLLLRVSWNKTAQNKFGSSVNKHAVLGTFTEELLIPLLQLASFPGPSEKLDRPENSATVQFASFCSKKNCFWKTFTFLALANSSYQTELYSNIPLKSIVVQIKAKTNGVSFCFSFSWNLVKTSAMKEMKNVFKDGNHISALQQIQRSAHILVP